MAGTLTLTRPVAVAMAPRQYAAMALSVAAAMIGAFHDRR